MRSPKVFAQIRGFVRNDSRFSRDALPATADSFETCFDNKYYFPPADTLSERRPFAVVTVGDGVRGMEERVRQFGGMLNIESGGAGTSVTVTMPLTPEQIRESA